MNAVATTMVTVLRGVSTNDYGDEVDVDTVIYEGIPASVIEQRRFTTTADDPQPRAVVFYTGRVVATADIVYGDRIRDEQTGKVYIVDSAYRTANPVITADLRLDLRAVA